MTRQYIGPRIVQKFYENSNNILSSEWQENVEYEALTIVTYLNSSYTSKKPVPVTVGNPRDNAEYWSLTGAYNAQVESYKQEVEDLKQRLNYVSVKEYGATGNGVTDDSEAFQAALNSNGNIYIPQGNYLIDSELTVKSNTIIFGEGKVFKTRNHMNIFKLEDIQNITFEGIAIEGINDFSDTLSDTAEIYINNCKDIVINGCRFNKTNNHGFIELHYTENIKIINNTFENIGYIAVWFIGACHEIIVENNLFDEVLDYNHTRSYCVALSSYDSDFEIALTAECYNAVIQNNICNTTEAFWEAIDTHGGHDILITDNIINGFLIGISTNSRDDGYIYNIVISNNIVNNNGASNQRNDLARGIVYQSASSQVQNSIIAGNIVNQDSNALDSYGIYLLGTNSVIVSDNNIYNYNSGIYINSGVEFNIINNIINTCVNGLYFNPGASVRHTGTVKNNRYKTCTTAVHEPAENESFNPTSMVDLIDNEYIDCTALFSNTRYIAPDVYDGLPSPNPRYAVKGHVMKNITLSTTGDVYLRIAKDTYAGNAVQWATISID